MELLDQQKRQHSIEIMAEYLSAPADINGKTPKEDSHDWDKKRIHVIENHLKPLINKYFKNELPLQDFKTKIDSFSKIHPHWGFRGIKGQMFFNMILKTADDLDECDQELKAAISVPSSDEIASSRIKTFRSYVKRLGDQWVDAGNTRYGAPKIGSIPFFLSYFWQIQDWKTWPVYYTNSVNTMTDMNLWNISDDLAENYINFKKIHQELAKHFTEVSKQPFDLYEVEHVFWFKGGDPYLATKGGLSNGKGDTKEKKPTTGETEDDEFARLPRSYVPPIVAILPRMARHEEGLIGAAKKSGITLDRAFEKYINAAFTILGYETQLLGQGHGRVPDGQAIANDESYAIIWDAKVRGDGYSMGTDDRTIREYISTQSRKLKKGRFLRNTYYLIISSSFADDFDDTIRSIKMETDISEVGLMEAAALVTMVDAKLRAPLQISLGPDGFQRLFSVSGIISAEMVSEQLI
jgi:hypothetical protein